MPLFTLFFPLWYMWWEGPECAQSENLTLAAGVTATWENVKMWEQNWGATFIVTFSHMAIIPAVSSTTHNFLQFPLLYIIDGWPYTNLCNDLNCTDKEIDLSVLTVRGNFCLLDSKAFVVQMKRCPYLRFLQEGVGFVPSAGVEFVGSALAVIYICTYILW